MRRLGSRKKRRGVVLDIERLLGDYRVPFISSGHKHCTEGWVQVVCPFCTGNPGWHLGYNKREGYWNCWRCGWKSNREVFEELLGLSGEQLRSVLSPYKARTATIQLAPTSDTGGGRKTPLTPLTSFEPLSSRHRRYLEGRGFDPDEIEREWGVWGTGPVGRYKHRIIIPIYHGGVFCSFQGRDITGRSKLKYKACRKEDEFIHHKHLLYGIDKVPFDSVVIVEGVFDVWRLGAGAVATFGIEWTWEQAKLMTRFERRFILFDPEPQAQVQAMMLAKTLADLAEGETEVIELTGDETKDPAQLSDDDAEGLMKELGIR